MIEHNKLKKMPVLVTIILLISMTACTRTESFARTTDQGGRETFFSRDAPSPGADLTLDLATTALMAALLLGGVAAISQVE